MKHVRLPRQAPRPPDINLPDSVKHRSGGASILLIPGQSNELTDEEWEFIKTNHREVLKHIQLLR